MKTEVVEQLLSRGLDGELSDAEQKVLADALARDPQLQAMEREWRQYAVMMKEEEIPAPPKPEVVASDVLRAIRLMDSVAASEKANLPGWRLTWVYAMGVLAILAAGVLGLRQQTGQKSRGTLAPALAGAKPVEVEFAETDLPGASPVVYEDSETGWAVVWVASDEDGTMPRGI